VLQRTRYNALLMCGVAAIGMSAISGAAQAEEKRDFRIAPQALATALMEFGNQSGTAVVIPGQLTKSKITRGVSASVEPEVALQAMLEGTGLSYRREGDLFAIVQGGEGGGPQSDSAEGGGAEVEALIVTAQKREEAIQDVPIAISAFSQKALEEQKIEGGYDLLKAIPNVTFSKSNFSGYNFSIRGVGTKAVSATTDQGVAVAFNNTTLIQNRLFEQEYYDIDRVEVLRGPQGTLYGRNATSGVINVITKKADLNTFEGSIKAEVGNYDSKRLVGMLNIPVIDDMLAIRIAGAGTRRTGYDYNELTGNNVNGRELWSGRISVGFEPMPSLRANFLWEHFEEDDNRSRTSKQLCHRDVPPTEIGGAQVALDPDALLFPAPGALAFSEVARSSVFSQGCKAGSLYDDGAYGTPNGLALPFVYSQLDLALTYNAGFNAGYVPGTETAFGRLPASLFRLADPYGGQNQSRDLRTIASVRDPIYRAKADVLELSLDFDITEALTLTSQTAYNEDEVYSFQDFNRFNSFPFFTDTSLIEGDTPGTPSRFAEYAPGGVFCDPQIGCTDRLAGFDISMAVGKQFSQELRLSSDFDGPVNFSAGANYTKFETEVNYYVFYNAFTAIALSPPFYKPLAGTPIPPDLAFCPYSGAYTNELLNQGSGPVAAGDPSANCPYVDPNPIESINGEGHNYFRSRNPYELKSAAAFGELYWNVDEALKVTAGLRYTKDEKTFIPVPSQVLLAGGILAGGTVSRGYPEKPAIVQEWGEWTGRLGVDWKPELGFTDDTLLYAFYSRGYKGGGANPPQPGFATKEETIAFLEAYGATQAEIDGIANQLPVLQLTAVDYSATFEPEFIDAFEVGAKNALLGGALTFNATGFYYDYKDYQVSQIKDRTAVNENFDATIWGLEFETVFSPSRDFRINANLGYLDTKIADGETSIDLMNRTQGDPNYTLAKPWVQLPSNCVLPTPVVALFLSQNNGNVASLCGGVRGLVGFPSQGPIDPNPAFGNGAALYDYLNYPELNGGAGIRAQLGGNELPNAPHWTTNVGAQYGRNVLDGSWRVTLRGDAYWQSQSWARVYNAVNDKLHGWYNLNVSVRLANEDLGLEGEFYIKNVLDKSPITDAFLNSDDTGLTTNVFVLDPRLVGVSLRKTF
jgi:iron complex outermembrane receptor protein